MLIEFVVGFLSCLLLLKCFGSQSLVAELLQWIGISNTVIKQQEQNITVTNSYLPKPPVTPSPTPVIAISAPIITQVIEKTPIVNIESDTKESVSSASSSEPSPPVTVEQVAEVVPKQEQISTKKALFLAAKPGKPEKRKSESDMINLLKHIRPNYIYRQLFQGWLKIRSKLAVGGQSVWHKRYFSLRDDGWMSYYKNEHMRPEQCYGWVSLYGCLVTPVVKHTSQGPSYKLNIENPARRIVFRRGPDPELPPCPKKRTLYIKTRKIRIKCPTEAIMNEWFKNLSQVIDMVKNRNSEDFVLEESSDEETTISHEESTERDEVVDSASASPESPRSEENFSPVAEKKNDNNSAGSEDLSLKDFTTKFLGNIAAKKQNFEAGDDQTFDSEDRKGLLKYIGKLGSGIDLVNVALPVSLNEPMSFLQRMCEQVAYFKLLDMADQCVDPCHRLMYLGTFIITQYSSERTTKPFNPILGETFEYVQELENGDQYRFVAEQVSHHPPIGASTSETSHFKQWSDLSIKTKFGGNSLTAEQGGSHNVYLKSCDETYRWTGLKSVIHNIIVGKMWIDHFGVIELSNKTGEKIVLDFKECGWFGKGRWEVSGVVYDNQGNVRIRMQGKRNEYVRATVVSGPELPNGDLLWTNDLLAYDFSNYWKLNKYAQSFNYITPELHRAIPPSDSRLRPDRIALEKQDLKTAATAKRTLEERQRDATRAHKTQGKEWHPTYFEHIDERGASGWRYKGGYWEEREARLSEQS